MIDLKQERTQAAMRDAGWFRRQAIKLFGVASPPADYRAESIVDLLANRKRMSFGQTVVLQYLDLEDFRPNDANTLLYDLQLRDETGELIDESGKSIVRAFPTGHNYDMHESLAVSIGHVGRGRIHLPILANGSSSIYTPLSQEFPLCLVSFVRDESMDHQRGRFELKPVVGFGHENPEGL